METKEDPTFEEFRDYIGRKFPQPQSFKRFESFMRWRWNFGIKIIDLVITNIGGRISSPVYEILICANKTAVIQWTISRDAFSMKSTGKRIIRTIQIILDKSQINAEFAREVASIRNCGYNFFNDAVSPNLSLVLQDIMNFSFKGFTQATTNLNLTQVDWDYLQSRKFRVSKDFQGYTDINWYI